ncbi:DMT family transporter [Roseibium sp.]|uniref:DMT family transporter n=1 Tax=Roseibium sp. TaxID=1936156 RepID=UPI003A982D62
MAPSSAITSGPKANLLGSLFMVLAMGLFALEDTFIKGAAGELPVGEILMLFGAGGAAAFALLAIMRGERLLVAEVFSKVMLVRFLFEFTGRLFYVLALALTPLSSATAILQATPIVVVMGAALVFGEKVGWRRWSAILIGLVGVLIVLQPGTDAFSPLSILAVIGMVGFAGRDLASRAAPRSLGTNLLGFYGFLTIVIAGAVFGAWEGEELVVPSTASLIAIAAAVIAGVCAYSALMKAMRTGEVASVTPFRYSRLLFGAGMGVAFFGEDIDAAMLIGCGLIVAAGLFILIRGRQRKAA